jgi:hypothetical protein
VLFASRKFGAVASVEILHVALLDEGERGFDLIRPSPHWPAKTLYVARVDGADRRHRGSATAKKSVISRGFGCGLDPSGLFSFTGFR